MADTDPIARATIAVHRGAWAGLSPEQAAMVAPPVTVSAMPLERAAGPVGPWRKEQLARSRGNMPVGRHHQPAR